MQGAGGPLKFIPWRMDPQFYDFGIFAWTWIFHNSLCQKLFFVTQIFGQSCLFSEIHLPKYMSGVLEWACTTWMMLMAEPKDRLGLFVYTHKSSSVGSREAHKCLQLRIGLTQVFLGWSRVEKNHTLHVQLLVRPDRRGPQVLFCSRVRSDFDLTGAWEHIIFIFVQRLLQLFWKVLYHCKIRAGGILVAVLWRQLWMLFDCQCTTLQVRRRGGRNTQACQIRKKNTAKRDTWKWIMWGSEMWTFQVLSRFTHSTFISDKAAKKRKIYESRKPGPFRSRASICEPIKSIFFKKTKTATIQKGTTFCRPN